MLELGFKQVSTHSDKLFYKKGELEVMLYKSDRIDRAVIETICENINLSYDYLVQMYKKSYDRNIGR